MKALSLLQPWASLWAAIPDLKIHETRSRRTHHRGPVAIHASARKDKVGRDLFEVLWTNPHHKPLLKAAGIPEQFDDLPFGCVIATTTIEDCQPTVTALPAIVWTLDELLGDYSPGRFAWKRGPVTPLACPIPCKGALGLWNCPHL